MASLVCGAPRIWTWTFYASGRYELEMDICKLGNKVTKLFGSLGQSLMYPSLYVGSCCIWYLEGKDVPLLAGLFLLICQWHSNYTKIDIGESMAFPLLWKISGIYKLNNCSSWVVRIGCWASFIETKYSFTLSGLS